MITKPSSETKRKAKMIAKAIASGKSDHSALESAGFKPGTAASGLARVFKHSPLLGQEVRKELDRWLKTGQCVPSAQERMTLIRQRLIMNVLEGKDKAVQSAKLLGQDREVNMFEPDVRVGLAIAVTPPSEWQGRYISSEDEPAESSEIR